MQNKQKKNEFKDKMKIFKFLKNAQKFIFVFSKK